MVLRWQHQRDESDGCGTRMHSVDFGCSPLCEEFSVIRRLGLLAWYGGQKNSMRELHKGTKGVVRPKNPLGARPAVWGYADVPGVRNSPGVLSKLRQREEGAAGGFGRQTSFTPSGLPIMWGGVAARRPSKT